MRTSFEEWGRCMVFTYDRDSGFCVNEIRANFESLPRFSPEDGSSVEVTTVAAMQPPKGVGCAPRGSGDCAFLVKKIKTDQKDICAAPCNTKPLVDIDEIIIKTLNMQYSGLQTMMIKFMMFKSPGDGSVDWVPEEECCALYSIHMRNTSVIVKYLESNPQYCLSHQISSKQDLKDLEAHTPGCRDFSGFKVLYPTPLGPSRTSREVSTAGVAHIPLTK